MKALFRHPDNAGALSISPWTEESNIGMIENIRGIFHDMATILVIDDEASIRNLLKEVLERANHRVLEARDGQEGLTLYQQNKVDLVLMDILMPGTDGLETTLQLTREYLDAKVIAMTGAQGDRNFLDVAKLFGARRVFEKPFDLDQLVKAVNEELAK